jgi:hypothetical protein
LSLYIWWALLGVHLLSTITLLVFLYFLPIFLYFLAVFSTMAIQDYGCVRICSALVLNAQSEITIEHYIIDDCFSCRKPNHKKGKCKKCQSLGSVM